MPVAHWHPEEDDAHKRLVGSAPASMQLPVKMLGPRHRRTLRGAIRIGLRRVATLHLKSVRPIFHRGRAAAHWLGNSILRSAAFAADQTQTAFGGRVSWGLVQGKGFRAF